MSFFKGCRHKQNKKKEKKVLLKGRSPNVLLLWPEVDVASEHGHEARHLFHVVGKLLVGAGGELVGHDAVDVGQHMKQLHLGAVVLQHDAQRLDEPRALLVVAPREAACREAKV